MTTEHTSQNLTPTALCDHPEGGRFQEVWRSPNPVRSVDGRERSALTHIYFHLAPGERSRFHRVAQDEVWNLYQGELRLFLLTERGALTQVELSGPANTFCAVIPAGVWQAAEPIEGPALVGCSVAPGFDFEDFTLITADQPVTPHIRNHGLVRFL